MTDASHCLARFSLHSSITAEKMSNWEIARLRYMNIGSVLKKHLFAAMSVALVDSKAEDASGLFEEPAASLARSGMHSLI